MPQITGRLAQGGNRDAALLDALALILQNFHSETGTIHLLDAARQELHLAAQIGLPPALLDVVRVVPVGKGIAGQTFAQGRPVSICNLQTDAGGVARPGAKQTGVGGALCVPLRASGSGDSIIRIAPNAPNQPTATPSSPSPRDRGARRGVAHNGPLSKIVGTLGIGTVRPHEYTPDETKRLEEIGGLLATYSADGR